MTRGTLALGAGLVVAAALGLYIMIGASDDPASAPPQRGQKIEATDPGKPRNRPALPAGSAAAVGPSGERAVRDHRAGELSQSELPPASPRAPSPPSGRQIDSHVTSDLSQNLRPALKECAANLAPEVFGKKSRIEGEILISIKDHQATVTAANFQLRDIAEAAQPQIMQCLVQRAVGSTSPAGDEADVEGYRIGVSLRWP